MSRAAADQFGLSTRNPGIAEKFYSRLGSTEAGPMKKQQQFGLWILLGLVSLALFVSSLFKSNQPMIHTVPFSDFIAKVQSHEITRVEIGGNTAIGRTDKATAVPSIPQTGL